MTPDTPANRALLNAVWRDDADRVRWAFEHGADANATYRHAPTDGSSGTDPMPLFALPDREDARASDTRKAVTVLRQFVRHGLDVKGLESRGLSVLYVALSLGDLSFARELLDRGADPNASLPGGGNAVHAAMSQVLWGNDTKILPLLQLVLERGADPNVLNSNGMAPLHDAALMGVPRTVALLLKHGADPNALTREAKGPMPSLAGLSPLLLAVRNGNAETIRLLAAAKRELTPVEAAASGNVPWLRKHLAAGLSPNERDDGTPLLSSAAASGSVEAVRLLLDRGAAINTADNHGRTALHDAALLGHAAVVGLLLARGAHPNPPLYHYIEVGSPPSGVPGGGPPGRMKTHREIGSVDTPLTLAVDQAQADVVALLLRHGADLTLQGNRDALARLMRNVGGPVRRTLRKDISAIPARPRTTPANASTTC